MNPKYKVWVLVFVLVTLACDTLGTKWYMEIDEDSSKPNMCYDKKHNRFFKVGESWTRHDRCEELACDRGDQKGIMMITGSTCPVALRLPPNCRMEALKPAGEYPDCCPVPKCNGATSGSISLVG